MQPKPFTVVGHTADIAVVVSGDGLEQLLENAAAALYFLTVNEPVLGIAETRRIAVTSTDDAALLIDWLNELIYLLYVERLVCSGVEVSVLGAGVAIADCRFAHLPPDVRLQREIKAATRHVRLLSYPDGGLVARVVFDV